MVKQATDFFKIFEVLDKYEVDYIIIGGVSAVLQGAPVTTFDLDVIHNREPSNVENLLKALQELNAHYRTNKNIRIEPEVERLGLSGHHLFITDAGPLDVLGIVGKDDSFRDYHELLVDVVEMEVEGMTLQLQGLSSVIELKQLLGRDKDKAVIPILRRTLEEKQKLDKQ